MHEFKKACKMQAGMGITDGIIQGKISCFRNKFHKHKEKCSEKRKFLGALCLRSEKMLAIKLTSSEIIILIKNQVSVVHQAILNKK